MTTETSDPRDADSASYRDSDQSPRFAAGDANELAGLTLPSRPRWPALLLGIVLGAAGVWGISTVLDDSDDAGTEGPVELTLATAPVEIRDLIEEVEWLADLGYGTPVDVAAGANGTVTAAAAQGGVLERGDVLVDIDDQPVVVLYGDVPVWRDLRSGDEGPDVEQLEMNLIALGYDPDDTVTIDEDFTANTASMVDRWQEDIGKDVTGRVSMGDFVVVPGPSSVTVAAAVGQQAHSGQVLATLTPRTLVTTIVGALVGEVDTVVPVGEAIEDGTVLYVADGVEVVAVIQTEVDDSGERVSVPEGLQVLRTYIEPGDTLALARPVIELAAPTLSVVIPVGLADQDEFSIGQTVSVELPDDTVVEGIVTDVGTVAAQQGGGNPTIDVTVEITELTDPDLPASEVTVIVAGDVITDALVVPTRALVTLAEGGFAVEKVLADGTTILVAVETGTFDDGVVEVESSQLERGDELVVPQ
jgi:peptidoglycan hydrolase-like protein with peptidoglycan-binding domain